MIRFEESDAQRLQQQNNLSVLKAMPMQSRRTFQSLKSNVVVLARADVVTALVLVVRVSHGQRHVACAWRLCE
jgi:hypothetical protein